VDSHSRHSYNSLGQLRRSEIFGSGPVMLTKETHAGKLHYGSAVHRHPEGDGKWPMISF
jgi:hypothetical protein